jgi:hypothetical protein
VITLFRKIDGISCQYEVMVSELYDKYRNGKWIWGDGIEEKLTLNAAFSDSSLSSAPSIIILDFKLPYIESILRILR